MIINSKEKNLSKVSKSKKKAKKFIIMQIQIIVKNNHLKNKCNK